ncbi:MAG: ClpXP protease specificity-enhancing factor SspB [Novosphingobium sp.]
MNDTPPDSLIPYDEIVQEALRAVVGRVLGQVEASNGTLPGNHHFYITFKTSAPGVDIPPELKAQISGPVGNDESDRDLASRVTPSEDGSNVVSVDFGKKK